MRKSSVKNLKKILPKIKNDPGETTRINSADDIVNYSARPVLDMSIKIIGGPNFNDVKEAKGKKNDGQMSKMAGLDEKPGNEHTKNFIDHNPRGVVHLVFLLSEFSDEDRGHGENDEKGDEEKERRIEMPQKPQERDCRQACPSAWN